MHKRNITAFILALIIAVPAAMAQSSSCTSVTPSNNAFSAALVGSGISGSPNGFGDVNLSFSGTRLRKCGISRDRDESVQLAVQPVYAAETYLRQLYW